MELRYEWVKEKDGNGGIGFHSRLYSCLKLHEIQAFAKKMPNRQAVAVVLRKCQLAGHKRAGPKTKNVLQCLQFAKIAIRQCKHGCKKRKMKKRKKEKKER
jgi:hypothetical protein